MSLPIRVPQLDTGGQELTVSLWFVDVGDEVSVGDRLVELLLPGMTFDVAAACSGTLAAIDVREGTAVEAGDPLGAIECAE